MTGLTERSMWTVLADCLAAAGCRAVFGLPADEPGLLDAADAHPAMHAVAARDQRVAACAAAGYALAARAPAVLALTTGPAFANAMAGVVEAASMCVPVVVVTTRVPSALIGRGAFQYVDQHRMAGSVVKWYSLLDRAGHVPWVARRAVQLAVNGRPGVTLIEVADEAARELVPADAKLDTPVCRIASLPPDGQLDEAASLLNAAATPVILAGGGTRWAQRECPLLRLAELLAAPVFTTASGRGLVDERHPLAVGCAGLYATPPADQLLDQADVVLAVGTQLEETVRMGWTALQRTRLIHIDIDSATFDAGATALLPLLGDAGYTTAALADRLARDRVPSALHAQRLIRISEIKAALAEVGDVSFVESPVRATLRTIQHVFGDRVAIVQENGLHDLWSYHYPVLTATDATTMVCPGEQTMMGFGMAASLGVATALPDTPVVVIAGDGAVQLSMGALPTLHERRTGVTIVMFDNAGFGWPRHSRRLAGAADHLTRFAAAVPALELVRAIGGWAVTAATADELSSAMGTARDMAREGHLTLIRVPTPDHDIPVGVRREFPGDSPSDVA